MTDIFNRKIIAQKKVSDRGQFKVLLVQITKEKTNISIEAIGNPPQGEMIEMQSSFKANERWKHVVWVRNDMHEEFFKSYLDMVKEAGWTLPNHELITQLVSSHDLGDHKIDIQRILDSPDDARQIMASIGTIRDNQTKDFRNDLTEFEKFLLERSNETVIHNFLKDHPWIFGIDYIHTATKDKFLVEFGEFDFLLERFSKVYDIVELKGINAKPFEEYRKSPTKQGVRMRWQISEDLSGAILQVCDYFDQFEKTRKDEDTRLKRGLKNYRNPRGQIIIGNREDLEQGQDLLLNQLNDKFNNIEILTYTDLFERAKYFVELLENSILVSNKNEK